MSKNFPNGRVDSYPKKIHLVADEFICRPNNKETKATPNFTDRQKDERTNVGLRYYGNDLDAGLARDGVLSSFEPIMISCLWLYA